MRCECEKYRKFSKLWPSEGIKDRKTEKTICGSVIMVERGEATGDVKHSLGEDSRRVH